MYAKQIPADFQDSYQHANCILYEISVLCQERQKNIPRSLLHRWFTYDSISPVKLPCCHLLRPMVPIRLFSILLSICLTSCSYRDGTLVVFPHLEQDTPKKSSAPKIPNPLFVGHLTNLSLNEKDRILINRTFERSPSFRETVWTSNLHRSDFLIIPRPAFKNRSVGMVCRTAEMIPRYNSRLQRRFITCCRKENGQWLLLRER